MLTWTIGSIVEAVSREIRAPLAGSQSGYLSLALVILVTCFVAMANAETATHTTSKNNITRNYTLLDTKELTGNPDAVVFAQVAKNSKSKPTQPIGVWYTGRQWSIFHEDQSPMMEGVSFTVNYCTRPNPNCFTVTAKADRGNESYLDHPELNGNPQAQLRLTQNWNPGGKGGVYNPASAYLQYNKNKKRWYIANENNAQLSGNAAFNVMVLSTQAQPSLEPPGSDTVLAPQAQQILPPVGQPSSQAGPSFGQLGADTVLSPEIQQQLPQPVGQPIIMDVDFNNWGFEAGLDGWTAEGTAFDSQPTFGDNVIAGRVRADFTLEGGGLGGDYWQNIPYPIGHRGGYWIGTYEAQPQKPTQTDDGVYVDKRIGRIQGDEPTGILTSPAFKVTKRWCDFLIGGGSDRGSLRVELQIKQADNSWLTALSRTSFRDSEVMYRTEFSMGEFMGKTARIQIIDNATGGWGHINVDDFRFVDELPRGIQLRAGSISYRIDNDSRVWGVADLHTHPMGFLGMGGLKGRNVLWGVPGGNYADYVRNPNLVDRDIPQCDGADHTNVHTPLDFTKVVRAGVVKGMEMSVANVSGFWPYLTIGTQGGRFATHERGIAGAKRRQEYLAGLHQQYHVTHLHRAYLGGVRLMSALAVHNEELEMVMSPDQDGRAQGGLTREIDVIRAHVCAMRQFARLNSDWMEIAYSPDDATRIIASNKLAVVLGTEVPDMGNLGFPSLDAEMDELHRLGIRQVTLIHGADNRLGGAALFQDVYNTLTDLLNRPVQLRDVFGDSLANTPGRFFSLRQGQCGGNFPRGECVGYKFSDNPPQRIDYHYQVPIGNIAAPTALGPRLPSYEAQGVLNSMGLTDAGRTYIRGLMARGILVDIAHMSDQSISDTLVVTRERAAQNNPGCRGAWANAPGASPFTEASRGAAVEAPSDCYDASYPLIFSHVSFRALSLTRLSPQTPGTNPDGPGEEGTTQIDAIAREFEPSDTTVEIVRRTGGMLGLFQAHNQNDWPRDASLRPHTPNDCGWSTQGFALELQYANYKTRGRGVALGTDAGLIPMQGPRFGEHACAFHDLMPKWDERDLPKEQRMEMRNMRHYPGALGVIDFYQPCAQHNAVNYGPDIAPPNPGVGCGPVDVASHPPLAPFRIGVKTYNYNTDGWANYGSTPDTLQDAKNLGLTTDDLVPLFRSAQDYIDMWRKSWRIAGCASSGACNPPLSNIDCGSACRGRCPDSPNAGAPPRAPDTLIEGPFTHDASADARAGVCLARRLPRNNQNSPQEECERATGDCGLDQGCIHRRNICKGAMGAMIWTRCEDDPDRPLGDAFHGPEIRRGACYGQRNQSCETPQPGYDREMQLRFRDACEDTKAMARVSCN